MPLMTSKCPRPSRAAAICFCGLLAIMITVGAGAQNPTSETSIKGKICHAAGQPLAGATVTLINPAGHPGRSAVTDSSGRFSLNVPEEISYKLRVSKSGFQTREIDVRPKGAVREIVEVRLEPAPKAAPEFSDAPSFTVAGVTDWSDAGLHGSTVNAAMSESLARDTAALGANSTPASGPETPGDRHRILGDAKEKSGDPLGAVQEYAEAAKLEPSEQNYFAWGVELLLHRASSAAVEVLAKGSADFPDSARILEALGAAYYENGEFTNASEAMCRVSDLNPKDEAPYLFLGRMEQAANDVLPCSKVKLARFAENFPASPQANFYRGLLYWKQARQSQKAEDFTEAERFLQRAAQLDPALGQAYLQLGLLYSARSKQPEALHSFQAAAKASPELSGAHYQLSLAYRRAGRLSDAEREFQRYEELRKSEEAVREKERKEMRQFITVLKQPRQ